MYLMFPVPLQSIVLPPATPQRNQEDFQDSCDREPYRYITPCPELRLVLMQNQLFHDRDQLPPPCPSKYWFLKGQSWPLEPGMSCSHVTGLSRSLWKCTLVFSSCPSLHHLTATVSTSKTDQYVHSEESSFMFRHGHDWSLDLSGQ